MRVVWNYLYAFPHERDEDYREMADWVEQITHLGPPDAILRIRYDRFSPYHFDAARHGVMLKPFETYAHVFPLPPDELDQLACFFEDTGTPPPGRVPIEKEAEERPGLTALKEKLDGWIGKQSGLTMRDDGEKLALWDRRSCAAAAYQELDGLARRVVLATRKALTPSALARAFPGEDLEPVLQDLKQRKLLLEVSGRLLSLPVFESTTPMSGHFPAGEVRTHDFLRRKVRA